MRGCLAISARVRGLGTVMVYVGGSGGGDGGLEEDLNGEAAKEVGGLRTGSEVTRCTCYLAVLHQHMLTTNSQFGGQPQHSH